MKTPNAELFIKSLPKEGIISWLMDYEIGQEAMHRLERKLDEDYKRNTSVSYALSCMDGK